jgi:signal transduction histidine kinase
MHELRELARGIHPTILIDDGLAPAVQSLADRAGIAVAVLDAPDERLPPVVEATAYFLVSEALANVAKHARATRTTVSVRTEEGLVHVEVIDDGVGGADPASGSGLRGLADRVAAVNGHITVTSPTGCGTVVRAEIPLPRVSVADTIARAATSVS